MLLHTPASLTALEGMERLLSQVLQATPEKLCIYASCMPVKLSSSLPRPLPIASCIMSIVMG